MLLQEALDALDKFIKENNIHQSKFSFVTCGDWDLLTCLRKESQYKKISYNYYLKSWINLKTVFCEYIGEKKRTDMPEMLQELKLSLDGRHHSGIDDAKNIAKIVLEMIKNGQSFCFRHVNNQLLKKKK
jgi:inhibitor of KinA sporulation pathway (predicted exonuclease)